jgi:hypothetical protein
MKPAGDTINVGMPYGAFYEEMSGMDYTMGYEYMEPSFNEKMPNPSWDCCWDFNPESGKGWKPPKWKKWKWQDWGDDNWDAGIEGPYVEGSGGWEGGWGGSWDPSWNEQDGGAEEDDFEVTPLEGGPQGWEAQGEEEPQEEEAADEADEQ